MTPKACTFAVKTVLATPQIIITLAGKGRAHQMSVYAGSTSLRGRLPSGTGSDLPVGCAGQLGSDHCLDQLAGAESCCCSWCTDAFSF